VPEAVVKEASYDGTGRALAVYAKQETRGKEYAEAFLNALAARVGITGGRLVDCGCSIGVLVDAATRRGFNASGIDLDQEAIAYGLEKNRSVKVGQLTDLPEDCADVIVLLHTLEHFPDPAAALNDCSRIVGQGGAVCVSVPCFRGTLPRIFPSRWYGWQLKQHYYHFSKIALERMLKQNGFGRVVAWCDSMDHRIEWNRLTNARQAVLNATLTSVAMVGGILGHGDQLHAIGIRE